MPLRDVLIRSGRKREALITKNLSEVTGEQQRRRASAFIERGNFGFTTETQRHRENPRRAATNDRNRLVILVEDAEEAEDTELTRHALTRRLDSLRPKKSGIDNKELE